MSADELRIDLEDELLWDPRIDDVGIEVLVDQGHVTLRGIVASFRDRREAAIAVKRVRGVRQVHNDLRVELPPGDRRDDFALSDAVCQVLTLDALVPASVDAVVHGGVVTLTGSVPYQFERDEAELVAGNVTGVLSVDNAIDLAVTSASGEDVKHWIRSALRRDARLDADGLSVETFDGMVTLSGTVRSWTEHDAALSAAWAAPGVAIVDDRILVVYSP
jgi:osmotically-inducible protein OsmY